MDRDDHDGDKKDPWDGVSASQPAGSSADWDALLTEPSSEDEKHPFEHRDEDRYERHGILGRGGMGRVLAVIDRRLRREVALKEVDHRKGGSREANARLAREAWITAQLEHPGIVPVYDSGRSEEGRLFYTMRLIRGSSLEQTLRETPKLGDRLRLLRPFLDACQAIAYAHSLGIIHRDLKPANIMIGEFGETQVVDWGLARPSDSTRGDRWRAQVLPEPHLTMHGAVAGTPAYMRPEQASGEPADERSDVWGLGAVLYELLTGQPPFVGMDSREVLKKLRTRPPAPIADLAPEAPVELIAIAQRALHRDPEERYGDARALAADVVRYVDGHHVRAYDYTPIDHLRRFLTAWKGPMAIMAFAAVVIGLVSLAAALQTTAERDRAQGAERDVRTALKQADDNLALALIQQARTAATAYARPEAEVLAAHVLALRESPEARGALAAFDIARPRRLTSTPVPDCLNHQLSRDATRLLCIQDTSISMWRLEPLEEQWSKPLAATIVRFNEFTDEIALTGMDWGRVVFLSAVDGSLLDEVAMDFLYKQVVLSRDGTDFFQFEGRSHLNRQTGEHRTSPLCPKRVPLIGLPLSGKQYVLLCADGVLDIGNADGSQHRIKLDLDPSFIDNTHRATLSDDERWMVLGTLKGEVALIDLEADAVVRTGTADTGYLHDLHLSPDNRILAIAGERGGVRLWHLPTGAWLGRLPAGLTHQVRFTDARTLVALGQTLQRWQLPEGLRPLRFSSTGGFNAVEFSPDGSLLVGAAATGVIRMWSMEPDPVVGFGELPPLNWQDRPAVAKDLAFSPDGTYLVGAAMHGPGLRVFRAEDQTDLGALLLKRQESFPYLRRVGVLQGGLMFGLSYIASGPEVWRVPVDGQGWSEEPKTLDHLRVPGRMFWEGETNHSGSAAVLADDEDRVYRLTPGDPPKMTVVTVSDGLDAVDISSDGERIALARRGHVEIISVATGERLLDIVSAQRRVIDVAFSADDRYIAAGQLGGTARIWSAQTGVLLAVLRGHSERVASVEFSPDGRWLATGSWDSSMRIWGLGVLEKPAEALVAEVEAAWGITLEQALAAEVH